MAKRKTKLTIRIPPYQTPRNAWRKKIHRIALLEAERTEISYRPSDKLELQVRLYLKEGPLFSHDLDKKKKALGSGFGNSEALGSDLKIEIRCHP